MAITVASSSQALASNTTDLTITAPSDIEDNDILVAFFGTNDNTGAPMSLPAGWTELDEIVDDTGQDTSICFGYKVASGESGDYTFTQADSTLVQLHGAIIVLRGCEPTNPLDVSYVRASHYNKVTNDISPSCQPITTNTDGAMVVCYQFTPSTNELTFMVAPDDAYTWTRVEHQPENGQNFIVAVSTHATAGTVTPGPQEHLTMSATDDTAVVTLAFKPQLGTSDIIIVPVGPLR